MTSDTRIDEDNDAIITDKHLDNALISFLCGLCIALAILLSLLARGCSQAPAVADSICEQFVAIKEGRAL